jgi:polyferredoxin
VTDPVDPARVRTIRRVLVVVFALLAVSQAVVGVLAFTVTDGSDSTGPLGVVMLVSAGLSATLSILFAVVLRRSR